MKACYEEGLEAQGAVRPRYDEARAAFSKSCMNSHDAASCFQLGLLVRDAKGGPRDLHRAAELFEIACKGEAKTACVELGLLLYEDRDGLKADPLRAVELFGSSCDQVDPAALPESGPHPLAQACEALGTAWREGNGVDPPASDEEKAAHLYARACDARLPAGCVSAGQLAQSGRKGRDLALSAQMYERGCKLDPRQGCFELARLHEVKGWDGADDQKAAAFYQKTCNIDPTRGCFEAAMMMSAGRVRPREGELEYLFNLACENGNSEACSRRAMK
jgi:hypothetical protein